MTFKTTAEIYQALLDGVWVRDKAWPPAWVVGMQDGNLIDHKGITTACSFHLCEQWEYGEPPKKTRTVELAEYYDSSDNFSQIRWIEKGRVISGLAASEIKPTGNTKTVEIEE